MRATFQEHKESSTTSASLSAAWNFEIIPTKALEVQISHHSAPHFVDSLHHFQLCLSNVTSRVIHIGHLSDVASEGFEAAGALALTEAESEILSGEAAAVVLGYRTDDARVRKQAAQVSVEFSFSENPIEKFLITLELLVPPEKPLTLGVAAEALNGLVFQVGRLHQACYVISNRSSTAIKVRVERNSRETSYAAVHRARWESGESGDAPIELCAEGKAKLNCVIYARLTGFFPFDLFKVLVYDGKSFLPVEWSSFTVEVKSADVCELLSP